MSTLNLYNVQKARFWDELLQKERLQSLKAVSAIKTIRAQSAKTRPVNEIGELLPGRSLTVAKRRPSDAKKPVFMRKAPIVRMEPTIPNITGAAYQKLKNNFRPQTAGAKPRSAGGDSAEEPAQDEKFGLDPRFASQVCVSSVLCEAERARYCLQVGYHLFGFSDIQKTFPIKDKSKATEYESADDFHDAMTLHDRKTYHPHQIYKRPVTASQDIGWNAFDPEYYRNRSVNRALVHPLKSSEMTKFAAAMSMSGRNR